jgi:hypothetical protein
MEVEKIQITTDQIIQRMGKERKHHPQNSTEQTTWGRG